MKRFCVYITDEQHERIKKEADKIGISFAENLRRILSNYYELKQNEKSS